MRFISRGRLGVGASIADYDSFLPRCTDAGFMAQPNTGPSHYVLIRALRKMVTGVVFPA